MKFTTRTKSILNAGLNRVGLQLDTLTAYRRESARLVTLDKAGYFDKPAFPILQSFRDADPESILDELPLYAKRFDDLTDSARNPVGYSFENGFFTSPDAEVLYCMIRRHRPRMLVEVGCGNSTRIARLALMDGVINSRLIAIDPNPRTDIDEFSDEIYRDSVENLDGISVFAELGENDVLSIDSSHELRAGNDLTHLYLRVFPMLGPGVIVHIHDIFLPYEYRADWVMNQRLPYSEQYLIQVMLNCDGRFEVLWPGYYLQRTLPDFWDSFPHRKQGDAQSLWLKTR